MGNSTLRLQNVRKYADIHQLKIGVVIENIQKNKLAGKKVDGEWFVLISASENFLKVQETLDSVERHLDLDKKLHFGFRFLNALIISPIISLYVGIWSARNVSSFEGAAGLTTMINGLMFMPIFFIGMLIISNKKIHLMLDVFAVIGLFIILAQG